MTDAMRCPQCGAQMNHQANKLLEPRTREEAEASLALGGVLVVVFACPNCGYVAARRDETSES